MKKMISDRNFAKTFFSNQSNSNFTKMVPLCSALMLVRKPIDDMPTIMETWPTDFNLEQEEAEFKASLKVHITTSSTFIFLFNTTTYSCISLHFEYDKEFFSLVILTRYPFYHFYKYMLRVASQAFLNDSEPTSPMNRYYYILTALSALPETPPSHLTITFPTTEFDYSITVGSYTYKDFDPTKYFSMNDIWVLWRALFMHKPILILTKDPFAGSAAVLSCASLVAPMQFTDNICLWLTETDPRFIDIINGESDLMIAASNSRALATATNHFYFVLNLSQKRYTANKAITTQLFTKMKRTLLFTNYEIDSIITDRDPYSDIVNGEIISDRFERSLKLHEQFNLPTVEEFEGWEKSKSFKDWRSARNVSSRFRDGILNVDPKVVFKGKSYEDVEKIYNKIDELIKIYSNDMHAFAVLKKHKKIAKKILDNEK
ncbi:hypothetical protein TRFO_24362 [Tritrichomonas foetus]|uniref:UDENN domain-containing protein n=1 Tax=Tritrichomonas foetus TaxID=1144522 RepID=A0A1J4KCJ4_9EUKA|nr:hypothetical protein TRFO_24362 [Tritrichomonas foetus]|eukprot:OHT07412.1 hypothetical protein TRFO_24362 [Tritrichomonas foetus]